MDVWQDGEQFIIKNMNYKDKADEDLIKKDVGDVFYGFLEYVQNRFLEADLNLNQFNGFSEPYDKGIAALTPPSDFWLVKQFSLSARDQYVLYEHLKQSLISIEGAKYCNRYLENETSMPNALMSTLILSLPIKLIKEIDGSEQDLIFDYDGIGEMEPIKFSMSFTSNLSSGISPCYHINTAREIIALDFAAYYRCNKLGRIGYCKQCEKLYKLNRTDSRFCSVACGRKFNENRMSKYDKKYRYMRKCISEYTEDVEARKAWRNWTKSLLQDINNNKQDLTPEQFAKVLRQKWEGIKLLYGVE